MKKLFIVFILLVLNIIAYCNTKDSLYSKVQSSKEDTSKIRLLIALQKYYATKDFDSSFHYLKLEEDLAKKLKTKDFDFLINTGYSEYYFYNNNYKEAIKYAQRNNIIAEQENDMKKMAKSYNNLAAIYNHFGLHQFAIDYILKCLDISEKTNDSTSFPIRNLTASNTYYDLKQYTKSVYYAKRAIEFGKKYDNTFAVMMGMNNLSASYSALNEMDSSIYISKQQLEMAKQQEDIVNIVYALINLCFDNFRTGNIKQLESYSKELSLYKNEITDSQAIAQIHNSMALNLIMQKKYTEAKIQLDSGINNAKNIANLDALSNLYQTTSVLYFTQNDIKTGEYYLYLHDSLMNTINLNQLNFYTDEMEVKYNTEKKETIIKMQQAQLMQKKMFNYLLITVLLFLLLFTLFLYFNHTNSKKLQQARIDELEKEKQLQATEAVLKGQEEERSRIAKDLHDGLGGLLSSVKYSLNDMKENVILSAENASAFTRSIDMLDSGIQELRRIAHNMMPENLVKFGLDIALKDYCQSITATNVLQISYSSFQMDKYKADMEISITVYRIIQELINNAIKHANASNVIVQLSNEKTKLLVTVEDNGKGFDVNNIQKFKGAGWVNIQNRINYLKGKLDIDSNANEGTSINFEIPLT